MSKYITCTECSLVLIVLTDATSHGCFYLAINDHISDTSACGHMFWVFPILVFPKGPNQIHKSPTKKCWNLENKQGLQHKCGLQDQTKNATHQIKYALIKFYTS